MATKVWNLATVIVVGARPTCMDTHHVHPQLEFHHISRTSHTLTWVIPRATFHTSQEPWPWNREKMSKGRPKHLQNHLVRSRALKRSVKSYVAEPSTKCYFDECLFMRVLVHDKIKWINGCECLNCHGLRVLCEVYLQKVVFENNPSDHENMIHMMPCKNPCRLYIHLAFTYSVGPLSVVWSELGLAPPFPPMRVLEV
jgi:hypothetical protein